MKTAEKKDASGRMVQGDSTPSMEGKADLVATVDEVVAIDDDFIKSRIFTIRGVQVMLDRDLAALYGVTTKRLNEQVKRNMARFPTSFVSRCQKKKWKNWSQIATSCNP